MIRTAVSRIALILCYSLMLAGVFPALPRTQAQVSTENSTSNKATCTAQVAGSLQSSLTPAGEGDGEYVGPFPLNLEEARTDPIFAANYTDARFQEVVDTDLGWFESAENLWYFCYDAKLNALFQPISVSGDFSNLTKVLDQNSNRIVFKNPLDYYALTGEPCTQWEESTCTLWDDSVWPNGAYDAPKADARILKTLIYLVTPLGEGGAGRERIKVDKILQQSEKNREFSKSDSDEEPEDQRSAHSYDIDNPSNPEWVAQAVDISEIDNLRVTTKITKKRRVGGSSTDYQYKTIPIKVAWQTDAGQEKAGIPSLNVYDSSLFSFNGAISEILADFDIEAEVDPANIDISNIGDLAVLIGGSLVKEILQGNSVNGWDLSSVLENYGRQHLAQQLGLPLGTLNDGNIDDLSTNVGRILSEQKLQLPAGSLKGTTSDEILTSLGRRYIESVLRLKDGTLAGATALDQATFLERVGEGRIAERLNITLDAARKRKVGDFVNANLKTKGIFRDNYEAQSYVDDILDLGYTQGVADTYGFSESEYEDPTKKMLTEKSDAALSRYKQLVGVSAIAATIGGFSTSTSASPVTEITGTPTACPDQITLQTTLGLTPQEAFATPCKTGLAQFSDNQFTTAFLRQFGISIINAPGSGPYGLMNSITPVYGSLTVITPTLVNAAISTPVAGKIIRVAPFPASGGDQEAQLRSLLSKAIQAEYDRRFQPTEDSVSSLVIPLTNEIKGQWQPLFSAVTQELELRIIKAGYSTNSSADPDVYAVNDQFATVSALINSYLDALDQVVSASGQSGRSGALDLPGTLFARDENGMLTNTKIISSDPVNTVLSGDLSQLGTIGRIVLGRLIDPSKTAQSQFVSQLRTDLSPLVSSTADMFSLSRLGVTESAFTSKGFAEGDVQRIFSLSLGSAVFKRIGEQELLRTVWQQIDIAEWATQEVGDAQSAAAPYLQEITQASAAISFYTTRLDRLNSVLNDLATNSSVSSELKEKSRAVTQNRRPSTITGLIDYSRAYEVVLKQIDTESGGTFPAIRTKVQQGHTIIQEIVAGRSLSAPQALIPGRSGSTSTKTTPTNSNQCWSRIGMRQILTKVSGETFEDYAREVGACQLDEVLSLPGGTLTLFLKGEQSYDGFVQAAGTASLNGGTGNAMAAGENVLAARTVQALGSQMPSFSKTLRAYQLTPRDVYSFITGDTEPVLLKIGGSMVDTRLNFPAGTTMSIARPTCFTPQGTEKTCTPAETNRARSSAMVKMGLSKLGLELNFPPNFDITGSGNVLGNYGQAFGEQVLGLEKGTFTGTFANVRAASNPDLLAISLGLRETPYSTKLKKLQNDIEAQYPEIGWQTAGIVASAVSGAQNRALTALSGTQSPYLVPLTNAVGQNTLAFGEAQFYIATLKDLEQATYGSNASALVADFASESSRSASDPYWVEQYGNAFREIITNTQRRVGSLATPSPANSLDATFRSPAGTFIGFLQGKQGVTAETLSAGVARQEITNKFAQTYLDRYLQDDGLKLALATITGLTKSSECTNGLNLGEVLIGKADTSNSTASNFSPIINSGCNALTLKDADLGDLWSSNSALATQTRGLIFDNLLSNLATNPLEVKMGLSQGSLRNFFVNPRQGRISALYSGMNVFASEVLGIPYSIFDQDGNISPKAFEEIAPRQGIVRNVFMATFFDPNTKKFTIRPSESRAFGTFIQEMDKTLTNELGRLGTQSIGTTITTSDLAQLISGNTNAFLFLGVQRMAWQQNKQLMAKQAPSGSNPTAFAQAKREHFIDYGVVRNSLGMADISGPSYEAAAKQGERQFMADSLIAAQTLYAAVDINGEDLTQTEYAANLTATMSDEELRQTYFDAFPGDDLAVSAAGESARTAYATETRSQAQQNLNYAIYDTIAFNVDSSIPRGFARAMIEGTPAQQSRAINAYALSALKIDTGALGGIFTPSELLSLGEGFAGGTGFTDTAGNRALVGRFSTFIGDTFTKNFGVELPEGTMLGLIGWAKAGFSSKTFSSATIGGDSAFKDVVPVGTILKNWGYSKVFSFGDSAFGFPSGTTSQIAQSVQTIVNATRSVQQAQAAFSAAITAESNATALSASINEVTDALGNTSSVITPETIQGSSPVATVNDNLQAAKNKAATQIREAQAQILSLVINSVFSREIAAAEQRLGLVPGTGAQAVGIGISTLLGAPVPWLQIALFVGMNLFGVYRVETTITVSSDGSFANAGGGGKSPEAKGFSIYPSPDAPLDSFSGKDQKAYQAGLKAAAQQKVQGVLGDLLAMPEQWSAASGDTPENLWISQVFTARQEDLIILDNLISNPAPWGNPPGWGYGPIEERATLTQNPDTGLYEATPNGNRFGFFYSDAFWNTIHVRW